MVHSAGVFDLALLTEDLRKFVAEAFTKEIKVIKPRSATSRQKAGRSKLKAALLDRPDLLQEIG